MHHTTCAKLRQTEIYAGLRTDSKWKELHKAQIQKSFKKRVKMFHRISERDLMSSASCDTPAQPSADTAQENSGELAKQILRLH
ncbi:hypothetical protein PGTUg99_017887 [Puccinia graminis f. sp. tritici]|uniref:Uncharacterized protein n=1 Tax=Puccinia graminis f. sp. tritici TaxID=56615 RepID=A0A5B0RIQ4_PUCGR|nr:hypothetical protein PGTUg99_017887 [Puccinia graminis f. sp. tritici]